jgi:tetratricopeptide (TPR) repeat protein
LSPNYDRFYLNHQESDVTGAGARDIEGFEGTGARLPPRLLRIPGQGGAYPDSGRYMEAISAAEASLEMRVDDVDPMLILAAAHAARGESDEARRIAEQVLNIAPTFRLSACLRDYAIWRYHRYDLATGDMRLK